MRRLQTTFKIMPKTNRRKLSNILLEQWESLPATPENREERRVLLKEAMRARDQEIKMLKLKKANAQPKQKNKAKKQEPVAQPQGLPKEWLEKK